MLSSTEYSSVTTFDEHSFHRKLSGWLGDPGKYYQTNSGREKYEELTDGTNSWCVWNNHYHGLHITDRNICKDAADAAVADGVTYDPTNFESIGTLGTGCYYEDSGKRIFWNVCSGPSCKPQDEWTLTSGYKVVCSDPIPISVSGSTTQSLWISIKL